MPLDVLRDFSEYSLGVKHRGLGIANDISLDIFNGDDLWDILKRV